MTLRCCAALFVCAVILAGMFDVLDQLGLQMPMQLANADTVARDGANQIVAEVHGRSITKGELEQEVERHLAETLSHFSGEEKHALRKRMLELMIKRRLLLEEAVAAGLMPENREVESLLLDLEKELGSAESLQRELAKHSLDRTVLAGGVREDMAINAYLEQKVFKKISISQEDARRAWQQAPQKFTTPEEVRVRHLLLKVPSNAEADYIEERRQQAMRLASVAREPGVDFATLVRRYSEAPNAGKGGELAFFTKNQLDAAFSQAAFALQPGESSDVVRTTHGFHIIKMEERRGGAVLPFEEVQDTVMEQLRHLERERALQSHLRSLRRKHKVIVYYQ
ncbi:MAG: peptidylprolyl isomerase [Bdellovibrionales bacterium]|nr:peptidylprolyl isomerase [Bdellovibrionales bacterium]